MKIKTAELNGVQLDWAVAKAEGKEIDFVQARWYGSNLIHGLCIGQLIGKDFIPTEVIGRGYSPSTNWSQGGPIIEREGIVSLYNMPDLPNEWVAKDVYWENDMRGTTYLDAAMRCYVASKLGDEVEIPEKLV